MVGNKKIYDSSVDGCNSQTFWSKSKSAKYNFSLFLSYEKKDQYNPATKIFGAYSPSAW